MHKFVKACGLIILSALTFPSGKFKEMATIWSILNVPDSCITFFFILYLGLVVRTKEDVGNAERVTHVSLMLLPSPVPAASFKEACGVQVNFNTLVHKVAHDYDFLKDCLKR